MAAAIFNDEKNTKSTMKSKNWEEASTRLFLEFAEKFPEFLTTDDSLEFFKAAQFLKRELKNDPVLSTWFLAEK